MHLVRRLLLAIFLALGVIRIIGYFIYASLMLTYPLEVYYLEAKMVLLAYRVDLGLSLYPGWREYPHVANFFGPVYFVVVGLLGRWADASIPTLFWIGRLATFGSTLATSAALTWVVGRRFGVIAGIAAGVLSLGSAPTYGFTVMVRPDLMAEMLGIVGVFLTGAASRGNCIAGAICLAFAVLTKQTAVVYLVAAVLALVADGRRPRALRLLAGTAVGLATSIVAVNLFINSNFLDCLLAEGKSPWDRTVWIANLARIRDASPDLVLLPLIGLGLALTRENRSQSVRFNVVTMVLLASSLLFSGKVGAEQNYFLSLRIAEALAVGQIWRAALAKDGRPGASWSAALVALSCVSLLPSLEQTARQVERAWTLTYDLTGSMGRLTLGSYERMFALARDPKVHMLTDSGLLDLYQGRRAAFGDVWLFRMLVQTGRLQPNRIAADIDRQYYDVIVTTAELEHPGYALNIFGFPMGLVDRIRQRYTFVRSYGTFRIYEPRRGSPP
jgi:hypothetical protein